MATTGLSEFKEVLSDFSQLHSYALKAAIAVPLADIWLKLGPPPAKTVGALTSLIEFIAVIWVFQFWSKAKDRALRTKMKIALGLFLVGIVSSLLLLQRFSVSPGQGREKVIEGLRLVGGAVRADADPDGDQRGKIHARDAQGNDLLDG